MEPELLFVPEMARFMGRSESAIRTAASRSAEWMPRPIKQGGRICWRLETVRQFIRDYESGVHHKPKVGRPRVLPQLVGQRVGR
jgi:predicted DNA-binding transcriptional regulator AlpA